MSYWQVKAGKGTARTVYNYLIHGRGGDGERALAQDVSDNVVDRERWWRSIDECDPAGARGRSARSRTYYHYVIAPRPEDFASISKEEGLRRVRELATRWAAENLGGCVWAAVYHDDAECGNIHAHIVCSAYDPSCGRKVQIKNADLARMRESCNEISRACGLTAFVDACDEEAAARRAIDEANARRERAGEGRVSRAARGEGYRGSPRREAPAPGAQRHAQRRGQRSWRSEIMRRADEACVVSSCFADYVEALRRSGVGVEVNRAGNIVYRIDWGGRPRAIRDCKLGMAYQTDLLAARFMDLRFTKAGWAAARGDYTRAAADGVRSPRVRPDDVVAAMAAVGALGGSSLADARSVEAGVRDRVRRSGEEARAWGLRARSLSEDLEDRRLVDGMAAAVEVARDPMTRRVDPAAAGLDPYDVDLYEAARKRLARRPHATDEASLEEAAARAAAERDRAEADARSWEARLPALTRAVGVLEALDKGVAAGARAERERYGARMDGASRDAGRAARGRDASRNPRPSWRAEVADLGRDRAMEDAAPGAGDDLVGQDVERQDVREADRARDVPPRRGEAAERGER